MSLKNLAESKRQLKDYTTIKIGGLAETMFVVSDRSELKAATKLYGRDFYLLGGGSNLLIADGSVRKPVLKLGGDFKYVKQVGTTVEVGAAVPFALLLRYCVKHTLGGLENLAGIPGTVGGMLVMNASSYQRAIGDYVKAVEVMDAQGRIKRVLPAKIKFSYRDSSLKGSVVLRVWLGLREERFVKEKMADFLKERYVKQDFSHPTFGCAFKNPPGFAAGYLIDSCGLKGLRKNGAQISPRHANFIINCGEASCADVDYLLTKAKEAVRAKHNIVLEEEVVRWI